jgi:hypothetical protein
MDDSIRGAESLVPGPRHPGDVNTARMANDATEEFLNVPVPKRSIESPLL